MALADLKQLRVLSKEIKQQINNLENAIQAKEDSQIQSSKSTLVELTETLQEETLGTHQSWMRLVMSCHELAAIAVVEEFEIAERIPDEGATSYKELSSASGCAVGPLTRTLRLLILKHIFTEPTPGFVGHSKLSHAWKSNKSLGAMIGHCVHDMFPAAAFTKDVIRKHGDAQDPQHAPFCLANRTSGTFFDFLTDNPARYDRFNIAMKAAKYGPQTNLVVTQYPWHELNLVVDVGGGEGHISIDIARANPKIHFIVQDLKSVVSSGQKKLPADLSDRITFEAHNMLEPQPVKNADAYFLRHVIHDWSNTFGLKILRALIPAMKPGARILLAEQIMPEPGEVSKNEEIIFRHRDLQMLVALNAKERTQDEFIALLAEADPRLQLRNVWSNQNNRLGGSIIEAVFTG